MAKRKRHHHQSGGRRHGKTAALELERGDPIAAGITKAVASLTVLDMISNQGTLLPEMRALMRIAASR